MSINTRALAVAGLGLGAVVLLPRLMQTAGGGGGLGLVPVGFGGGDGGGGAGAGGGSSAAGATTADLQRQRQILALTKQIADELNAIETEYRRRVDALPERVQKECDAQCGFFCFSTAPCEHDTYATYMDRFAAWKSEQIKKRVAPLRQRLANLQGAG